MIKANENIKDGRKAKLFCDFDSSQNIEQFESQDGNVQLNATIH